MITAYFERLRSFFRKPITRETIIERIPYIGLDIEEETEDHLRIEYNPNRPDFSTDYGVARALKGLLGYELGSPKYSVDDGAIEVRVDKSVIGVRPYFVGMVAKNVTLDNETIRQIICMQEDLDNGLGRNRSKVSIGIHSLDALKPPIRYITAQPYFRFTPLGENSPMSMKQVLEKTEVGRKYAWIISGHNRYPLLVDAENNVLSFPPIINGVQTRVSDRTRNLFIDITATDQKVAEDCLALIAAVLSDAGGRLESIKVMYPDRSISFPDLSPLKREVDVNLARKLLGLDMTVEKAIQCLARSRITAKREKGRVFSYIPRYRIDYLHPMDLVEEIAIGYGIDNFVSSPPSFITPGKYNDGTRVLDSAREVMVGLGMVEAVNPSLFSYEILHDLCMRRGQVLKISNTKSIEYEILRDMLIPGLLKVLSRNIHQPYPQHIFEIAKTFNRDKRFSTGVREDYHLGAVLASSGANFTEAKSYLTTFLSQILSLPCNTIAASHPTFQKGRVARMSINSENVGVIGEIRMEVLENFSLRTPVSAFEIDLSKVLKIPSS